MLLKLAIKNVYYSLKNYIVFLTVVVFHTMMFFLFLALCNWSEIAMQSKMISAVLRAGCMLSLAFVALFFWYSMEFFLRKRKRELGMYMLLGIRKAKIVTLVFYETFLMGMAAVLVGMFLGKLAFPLSGQILLKVAEIEGEIPHAIPVMVWLDTLLKYFAIFTIISIGTTLRFSKSQLADLFCGEEKEEIPAKIGMIRLLSSIGLLAAGYGLILSAKGREVFLIMMLFGAIFVILGTFLFFSQVVGGLFGLRRRMGFCNTNLARQMNTAGVLYRVRKNVNVWAITSLLVAGSMAILIGGYSLYEGALNDYHKTHPFSYNYISQGEESDASIRALMQDVHQLLEECKTPTLQVEGKIGTGEDVVQTRIVSWSSLEKLLTLWKGKMQITAPQENEAILLNYCQRPELNGLELTFQAGSLKKEVTISEVQSVNPLRLSKEEAIFVVSDQVFSAFEEQNKTETIVSLETENPLTAEEISLAVLRQLPVSAQVNYASELAWYIQFTKAFLTLSAIFCCGLMMAVGSILYFRVLGEVEEDLRSYEILNYLGAGEDELVKIVKAQMRTMFFIPYFISFLHLAVCTRFLMMYKILSNVGAVIFGIAVYLLIYIGYYAVATRTAKKIVLRSIEGRKEL